MSEALNLEAAVGWCALGVHSVCARAQGLVVAGRFWCSYAWVSLTQARACAPVGACGRARVLVRARARLCVHAFLIRARARLRASSTRPCALLLGGWVAVLYFCRRRCGGVALAGGWVCWLAGGAGWVGSCRWCGGVVSYLFSASI